MKSRFSPVFENYLDVLQGQLLEALHPTEAPPIVMARIEYFVFLENIDQLKAKMRAELASAISGWLDVADEIEMRDDLMQLIDQRIENFKTDLAAAGLERLLEMAEQLKKVDDNWRAANPAKAAEFPPD